MAKLYFYFSAMNAGKTTTLLQSAHNYRERGMRVAILTPKLDFRAGSGTVASRIGLQAEGIAFERDDDLRRGSSMPTSPRTVPCTACWSTKRNSSPRRRPGS
jgi:thymidine kinase